MRFVGPAPMRPARWQLAGQGSRRARWPVECRCEGSSDPSGNEMPDGREAIGSAVGLPHAISIWAYGGQDAEVGVAVLSCGRPGLLQGDDPGGRGGGRDDGAIGVGQ